jgi:1,2-diacylglycerol 3-alpha-glucosyltransferase/glucuronosyltransferase
MRVLVATDAWRPQINGVVRTLTSLARSAQRLGVRIEFLTPEGFPTFPLPTYPGVRLALPRLREIARRIEQANPDAIHIATEGPIGMMVRRFCREYGRPFTTSYTTRFPEYVSLRAPIPQSWVYAALRRFHDAAALTMVSTRSLMTELGRRGFANLAMWTRGVDTELFRPERAVNVGFERPIFVSAGRIAVEKNLEAFLALDLPGTKIVIGDGPHEVSLRRRFPNAKFLGVLQNAELAGHLAAADVFVFPSRTDTFGIVQLEALASGVPVAAFPVTGPRDLVGGSGVGVLSEDLRAACLGALGIPRQTCRAFALMRSWENSARQFIGHVQKVAASARRDTRPASLAREMETAHGESHAGVARTTYAES